MSVLFRDLLQRYSKSNSTYSICCGFVVQQAVQQVHNKSTTNPQQIHDKSTTNRKLYDKSTTSPQQIWRLQQIHNISTCRVMYNKSKAASKSTTNPQQIEVMEFSRNFTIFQFACK